MLARSHKLKCEKGDGEKTAREDDIVVTMGDRELTGQLHEAGNRI